MLIVLYTLFQYPLQIFSKTLEDIAKREWQIRRRFPVAGSRFFAAFCSAWLSLPLLRGNYQDKLSQQPQQQVNHQRLQSWTKSRRKTEMTSTDHKLSPQAGRSLDLTLFAVSRSLETVISYLWMRWRTARIASAEWTSIEAFASYMADPIVFAASSGVVMWSWFYYPGRLPRSYNRWIGGVAQVDPRLVEALRLARMGDFVYGRETGHGALLESLCTDLNLPITWGNPKLTIPIPCEVVHSGPGPSCHWHGVLRFARAFKFAFATYFPIQLFIKAKNPSCRAFNQAFRAALRSSAFLGAFVGLFHYGVCLARTILGPKLLQPRGITPLMWDQGLCIRIGCMLCGTSVFIEVAKRRQEMAFFVAPKAMATFLPRRYSSKASSTPTM